VKWCIEGSAIFIFTARSLMMPSFLRSSGRKAQTVMGDLKLRPLDIGKSIGTLSGGNQQKVIIQIAHHRLRFAVQPRLAEQAADGEMVHRGQRHIPR
jgi:hypothetical protein